MKEIIKTDGIVDFQGIGLTEKQVSEAMTIEEDIMMRKGKVAEEIIGIGNDLIRMKELLPHGTWGSWLENNVSISDRTARGYMQIARRFGDGKWQTFATLAPSKLSLLSGLPDEILEGLAEEDLGELSVSELKSLISENKIRTQTEDIYLYFDRECDHETYMVKVDTLKSLPHYDILGAPIRKGDYWSIFLNGIKKRGILIPVMITRDGTIIDGHERVRAAKELGMEEIPATYVFSKQTHGLDYEQLCWLYYYDLNRWDHIRTSMYYFFSHCYYMALGDQEKAYKYLDLYFDKGPEVEKRYIESMTNLCIEVGLDPKEFVVS